MVFNHLDEGKKGYIDYSDFCNLCDERRMKIDPAEQMLQQYKEIGRVLIPTGKQLSKSPSRAEKERRLASPNSSTANKSNRKTELASYLDRIDMEQLEQFTSVQQKRRQGKPNATSMTKRSPEVTYGKSSYHKGDLSDLKGVLSNDGLREVMLNKVTRYLDSDGGYNGHSKPTKRSIDNKTTEMRKELVREKQRAISVLLDDQQSRAKRQQGVSQSHRDS